MKPIDTFDNTSARHPLSFACPSMTRSWIGNATVVTTSRRDNTSGATKPVAANAAAAHRTTWPPPLE